MSGNFVVNKNEKVFSAIAFDQEHLQNNNKVNSEGGTIGILDNANALRQWTIYHTRSIPNWRRVQ